MMDSVSTCRNMLGRLRQGPPSRSAGDAPLSVHDLTSFARLLPLRHCHARGHARLRGKVRGMFALAGMGDSLRAHHEKGTGGTNDR